MSCRNIVTNYHRWSIFWPALLKLSNYAELTTGIALLRGCEAIRVINWDEFLFFLLFFFFVMVVANCNASCYWLHVHCSQWQLLLFFPSESRLHLSQYGGFHVVSLDTAWRDAQTLNLLRNVSIFYAWQVVSWMNEQQSQNLLLKVDGLSVNVRNRQRVNRARWGRWNITSAKLLLVFSGL